MIKNISFFLVIFILLASCKRDPLPSKAINRKTFINILVDIHIAEGMYLEKATIELDSLKSKSLYLSVLKKHKVSEERMLTTTLYYSRHTEEYDKIFTEVLSKMNVMLEELQSNEQEPEKK